MKPVLELPPHHVHLWILQESEVQDAHLLTQYRALMSEEERHRETRFRFPADRHRYLLTRALVRTVLSRYLLIQPQTWQFNEDSEGRPEVANLDGSLSGLSFNLSHAAGVIACGVARPGTIGVDLESVAREPVPFDVAEAHFSAAEVAALRSLPPAEKRQRFFEYWTLKESYLKAIGKGLSVPLNELSFDLTQPGAIDISFANPLRDSRERWQFLLLKIFAAHLLAICVDRRQLAKSELVIMKSIPLRAEQVVDMPLLRQAPVMLR